MTTGEKQNSGAEGRSDLEGVVMPFWIGGPQRIDWGSVRAGEKRWDQWCHDHVPGVILMTPRTPILEEMARCSDERMETLAAAEVAANRLGV